MNLKRNGWIRFAFACLFCAWLPGSAAAQPLVYVASESAPTPSTKAAQFTIINSATGHLVKTLDLGEWTQSNSPAGFTASSGA